MILRGFPQKFSDRLAAGRARKRFAVDDRAGDRDDADIGAAARARIGRDPVGQTDGLKAGILVLAGNFGDTRLPVGPCADLVNHSGLARGRGKIVTGRFNEIGGCCDNRVDIGVGPSADYIFPPRFEQRVGERLTGLAGFGRLVGAAERFNGGLEFADAEDVHIDAYIFQHVAIIKSATARAEYQGPTHRMDPDFAGMGGERIGVVAIAGRIGDHGLVCVADRLNGIGDAGNGGLAAAEKSVEIERDGCHTIVGRRAFECLDDIAQTMLGQRIAAGEFGVGAYLFGLFDDHAFKIEMKRALAWHTRVGAGRQQGVEKSKKSNRRRSTSASLIPTKIFQAPLNSRITCSLMSNHRLFRDGSVQKQIGFCGVPPRICQWQFMSEADLPAYHARDDQPDQHRRRADRQRIPKADIDDVVMRAVHRIGERAETAGGKAGHRTGAFRRSQCTAPQPPCQHSAQNQSNADRIDQAFDAVARVETLGHRRLADQGGDSRGYRDRQRGHGSPAPSGPAGADRRAGHARGRRQAGRAERGQQTAADQEHRVGGGRVQKAIAKSQSRNDENTADNRQEQDATDCAIGTERFDRLQLLG